MADIEEKNISIQIKLTYLTKFLFTRKKTKAFLVRTNKLSDDKRNQHL